MGFLFIKSDIQITLCFFFSKIWNLLLPIYTGLHLTLSDLKKKKKKNTKPRAGDRFEICRKVIKQEAEVYSNDEEIPRFLS